MNKWIRQTHRWLSMAFIVGTVINVIALSRDAHAPWVGALAALPLILLMLTGLYLFVLPYVSRRRGQVAASSN